MTGASQKPESALRLAAMNALTRREHSREELRFKLAEKFSGYGDLLAPVLDRLERDGLLSDRRFADAFTHSRIRRGHGPVRIRAELKRRGVDEADIEDVLAGAATDWPELAARELVKRFGDGSVADARERARRMRFLQQRGFDSDSIRMALRDSCARTPEGR